ncbi:hypothetical protein [Thermococcus sp.]|uniref:hypothetical protein n=1 Tax=Thermococcus sp. TaxID=35749 RepID=UPI00262F4290|nr:hypothetical protein [Thermococcus sp.]
MSRLVSCLFIFLLLIPMVSAVYSVKAPGGLYEVQYSVLSNGTGALIHLSILQWGIDCGMTDCWPAVFYGHEYLLYFNGSHLYLLNFTPVLRTPYVEYKGASFLNGSWYIEVKYFNDEIDKFYRLDIKHLCIEPANVSWLWLPKGNVSDSIYGWKIELQSLGPGEWGPANVSDIWIALSRNVSRWSPGPVTLVNSSVFPVYFTLKKDNNTRKVTIIYVNTTNNSRGLIEGFWFPKSVKIVNVTACKLTAPQENTTLNETKTQTSAQRNITCSHVNTVERMNKTSLSPPTFSKKNICGPGLMVIIVVGTVLIVKKRRAQLRG